MDYYGSLVDTFDTWYPWPQYKTFVRYNVLLPIPHSVIEANTQGHINQNEGYDGAHNNVPPVDTIE